MDALPSSFCSSPFQNKYYDEVLGVCNPIASLEKRVEIHNIEKMYEEHEQYLLSEIARYAADYQRLVEERNSYEERENYLLSEISHLVSGNPSLEIVMARHKEKEDQLKARVTVLERCYTEMQELLHLAMEDTTESEKSSTHFLEDKSTTVMELIQSKEKLEEEVMFSQLSYKNEQDADQLNDKMSCLEQKYQEVVCERDALRDNLDDLLNNPNGNTKIISLMEEKEELEERLSSVIEQKLSIQNYLGQCIVSMKEENRKLIDECNKYKECNDKLKVGYEGVIHEIAALQAHLDFIHQDLARPEKKESAPSESAKLKMQSEELVKQLTMKEEKKGKQCNDCVAMKEAFVSFSCPFMLITGVLLLSML